MEIHKIIVNEPYQIEIIIKSRTLFAHSMLTDYKENIIETIEELFHQICEEHREKKG